MQINCDLHVHSLRSTCGFHTFLEVVSIMKERGLSAFALTDHGPVHDTPRAHFSVMLKRLPKVVQGLRVFKGIEATILSEDGVLDLPEFAFGKPYECVLAGLHHYGDFESSRGIKANTRAVVNTIKNNPEVNIVSHPFFKSFPLDLDAVSDAACETGTALEINNSYLLTGKADTDALHTLLEHAAEKGTLLSLDSDGHIFHEIGYFEQAIDFLDDYDIEKLTIVNKTLESTLAFLGLDD